MNALCSQAVLLLLATTAIAGDDAVHETTPTERLARIQKEYAEVENTYYKALQALPDTPDGNQKARDLSKAYGKDADERFTSAIELAKAEPNSDTGFSALEWVLTIRRSYHVPAGKAAMELVTKYHAANPKIGKIVASIGANPLPEIVISFQAAKDLIEAVADKNPDRTTRGQAVMALALGAHSNFAVAEYKKANDVDALATKAEKAFETVVTGYADCPWLLGRQLSLGEKAKLYLHELRNLRTGKVAPEIHGEDLDGVKFKLGDHRGKVVLLVFWASWCGPCMAEVPHERELVEKLKGRPFVLVGVNGDETKEVANKATEREKISWRSFWNGTEGPGGPIAKAWNVRGWPTVYIIDHEGVIRHKYLRGNLVDAPLQKLVVEAEVDADKPQR